MMKKLLFASVASVAFVAFATPAAAQDFTGFRVEGRIGYDFPVSSGVTLGVYAGADFSDSDFCRTNANIPVVNPLAASVDEACLEVKRDLYIGGRAGMQVGPTTLIYGKAGYSNGQAEIEFNDVDDLVDDLIDSDARDGWHFGAGVEHNFGPNFYGKLEFLYTIYSDLDFENPDYTVTVDGNRSRVMAGIGARF